MGYPFRNHRVIALHPGRKCHRPPFPSSREKTHLWVVEDERAGVDIHSPCCDSPAEEPPVHGLGLDPRVHDRDVGQGTVPWLRDSVGQCDAFPCVDDTGIQEAEADTDVVAAVDPGDDRTCEQRPRHFPVRTQQPGDWDDPPVERPFGSWVEARRRIGQSAEPEHSKQRHPEAQNRAQGILLAAAVGDDGAPSLPLHQDRVHLETTWKRRLKLFSNPKDTVDQHNSY
mmetsp:Transcript_27339/g.64024  ORF Transcript_27339/g.64024 Transcript_27339/m.64024 type:complete len:227 (+) Transcript_27339:963-1643(+)